MLYKTKRIGQLEACKIYDFAAIQEAEMDLEKQQRNHRKGVKEARNTLTPPVSPDNDVPIANRAMPPESSELKTKRGRPKMRSNRTKAYDTIVVQH